MTRPAKIGTSESAKTKRKALTADRTSPASRTGLRPITSESSPKASSPAITPNA